MKMTPSLRRIMIALDRHGDLEYRVAHWIRSDSSGPPRPVFSVSPGESAKRPAPFTPAQKCRRWKKRAGYYKPEYRARKQTRDALNELMRITA